MGILFVIFVAKSFFRSGIWTVSLVRGLKLNLKVRPEVSPYLKSSIGNQQSSIFLSPAWKGWNGHSAHA